MKQERGKVRKDRQGRALRTKVHAPRNKRVDRLRGKIIDDWWEQHIAELEKHGDK